MITKTIFRCNLATSSLQEWTITAEDGVIHLSWGKVAGKKTQKREKIKLNQSGRNLAEQTLLEFNSRVSAQWQKGYCDSILEAKDNASNNALGLPKPMLALVLKPSFDLDMSCAYIQRKYDGNRCMIVNMDGKLLAYSRRGKEIHNIDHILDNIQIPNGTILDGEIYCHGQSLQTICSWLKREQPNTNKLKYHAYDVVKAAPFIERLAFLNDMGFGENTEVVPTHKVQSLDEAMVALGEYRSQGYEGVILRSGKAGYEPDKRSKGLVKIKKWLSTEFKVVDVFTNQDGWGILWLVTHNGVRFKATAPGTVADKKAVGTDPFWYINKWVTVEYAYLTKDGVPFHPVAKCWASMI